VFDRFEAQEGPAQHRVMRATRAPASNGSALARAPARLVELSSSLRAARAGLLHRHHWGAGPLDQQKCGGVPADQGTLSAKWHIHRVFPKSPNAGWGVRLAPRRFLRQARGHAPLGRPVLYFWPPCAYRSAWHGGLASIALIKAPSHVELQFNAHPGDANSPRTVELAILTTPLVSDGDQLGKGWHICVLQGRRDGPGSRCRS
jgi:hypothetical protein